MSEEMMSMKIISLPARAKWIGEEKISYGTLGFFDSHSTGYVFRPDGGPDAVKCDPDWDLEILK